MAVTPEPEGSRRELRNVIVNNLLSELHKGLFTRV